jgi:hypothetical protein
MYITAGREKANGSELYPPNETGNVGAIYMEQNDRARNRDDIRICNYLIDILEKECNCDRGPISGHAISLGDRASRRGGLYQHSAQFGQMKMVRVGFI